MGGPKAQLEVRGQPILTYLLQRLAWTGPKVLVTAPGFKHPPGSDLFDQEVIDPEEGAGPLRGILTALEHLQTQFVVVATVDMPDVTAEILHSLVNHLVSDASLLGAMCARTEANQTVIEPFPLALRREALAPIRLRYQSNNRSIHRLLDTPGFTALGAPDSPDLWTNLNTPSDLARWISRL